MEQISSQFIASVASLVSNNQKFVIIVHKNPDGDALGSGLALYKFLKAEGKAVTLMAPNALPKYLKWMPSFDDIVVYEDKKEEADKALTETDVLFMLDFNHSGRISSVNDVVKTLSVPKVMIDHHPGPEDIADYTYSRVSSSSTAEMVYELLSGITKNDKLALEVANSLMVGILTDTGTFSYNSSNPLTFKVVSGLLLSGVNKDAIVDQLFNNGSEARLRLLGTTLKDKMVVLPEHQAAYITLSKKDLDEYNFEQGDTEGFVNYPLSMKGIVFSAIFMEKDNVTRCSFRSIGTFPANLVSQQYFNGGGHRNAAGGESKVSLDETVKQFISVLPEFKSYLND